MNNANALLRPESIDAFQDWDAMPETKIVPRLGSNGKNGSNGKFTGQVDTAKGTPVCEREWWLPWSRRSNAARQAYINEKARVTAEKSNGGGTTAV
jgi:hypothetical protein